MPVYCDGDHPAPACEDRKCWHRDGWDVEDDDLPPPVPFRVVRPWFPLAVQVDYCLALYYMTYVAPLGGKVAR